MWWPLAESPLAIEIYMIKAGGHITRKDGSRTGNGLLWHWQRAKSIIWPERKAHRWDDLRTECFLKHTYVAEMGCAAGGKTDSAACNVLLDWYIYPTCTTVLISSTDLPTLRIRVWGVIKSYHRTAKENYPWLPGHLIEGKDMITIDSRKDCEEGRDFRNGLLAVPCKKGGAFVGLSAYCGVHNKRVRLIADELSM